MSSTRAAGLLSAPRCLFATSLIVQVGRRHLSTQISWDRDVAGCHLGHNLDAQETTLKLRPQICRRWVVQIFSGFPTSFALTWSHGLLQRDLETVVHVHSFIFATMPLSPKVVVQV